MKKKVLQVLAIILALAVLAGLYPLVRKAAYEAGRRARLEHEKTVLLQQQTDSIVNNTTAEDN